MVMINNWLASKISLMFTYFEHSTHKPVIINYATVPVCVKMDPYSRKIEMLQNIASSIGFLFHYSNV